MQLVTVYKTLNPADAQLVQSRLEAAEFHPFIKNELSALSLAFGHVEVQVPETEVADAKEFLETPGESIE